MVNRELFDLFNTDSTDKQFHIEFDEGVITNKELHSQSFELTESLCSEKNLRFGCCEASSIKFTISNIFTPLKDKWLTVTMTLNKDSTKKMTIGKYKVYSDVPTADRRFRDVVAYDSMYDIINTDVSAWYNGLTFPMTMKAFRGSFVSYFGLMEEDTQLVNDGMTIEKTVEPSEMSGRDVITSICELNGVFGHIGRDGRFKYINIAKYVSGLYPSDDLFPDNVPDYLSQGKNTHLYPQGEGKDSQKITNCENYISCQYEDYIVNDITKLQIREKEGDIGVIYGDGDNAYVVQDNFLVYGKSTIELLSVAKLLFQKIRGAVYRPFKATVKGCPCFEVGDYVQFKTKYAVVSSYILKRTLKGIQALRDNFSSDGEMLQPEKVNDIHTSIIQLKGKSNVLERTIEETKSTITDVESGLQSQIAQTAESITSTVSKSIKSWATESIDYKIDFYGFGNPDGKYEESSEIAGKTYLDQESGKLYEYYINPASGVGSWAFVLQLASVESSANSKIEQTATGIELSVASNYETKTNAQATKTELESKITQTETSINLALNEKTTEAKEYADDVANTAEENAKSDTQEKLKLYSTTTEMQSAIDISKQNITSTVSKSIKSWATEEIEYDIDFYGFGSPENTYPASQENIGKIYLDQENGYLYECYTSTASGITDWRVTDHLISVENSSNSKIEQTAHSIVLETTDGEKSAGITIQLKDANGNTISSGSENITLTGVVGFSDLLETGKTVINGANITTGSINCDLLNGGTIFGQKIYGGTINGTTINVGDGAIGNNPNLILSNKEGAIVFKYGEETKGAFSVSNVGSLALATTGFVISENPDILYHTETDGYFYIDIPIKTTKQVFANSIRSIDGKFYVGESPFGDEDEDYEIVNFSNVNVPGVAKKILYIGVDSEVESFPVVIRGSSLKTEAPLYCHNMHVEYGHIYMSGHDNGMTDTESHGILEIELSKKSDTESVQSVCLGYSGFPTVLRGTTVHLKNAGGATVTSDERLKNSFKSLDEFKNVYMDLEPCAFKYNNGTSDRFHFGFKAQNVENALLSHGYTTKDFAGFVQSYDKEGSDGYCGVDDPKGLIYTEFVAWNTHMIQRHERDKESLERRISELENRLSSLAERLGNL